MQICKFPAANTEKPQSLTTAKLTSGLNWPHSGVHNFVHLSTSNMCMVIYIVIPTSSLNMNTKHAEEKGADNIF